MATDGKHQWRDLIVTLIEEKKLWEGTLLGCVVKEVVKKVGVAAREGIKCCCGCHETYSMSRFEIHAGSRLKKGSQYIFLLDGSRKSLAMLRDERGSSVGVRETQISGEPTPEQENRTCDVCLTEGEVVCCSTRNCPAAVHVQCCEVQDLEHDEWHCQKCSCPECRKVLRSNDENIPNLSLVLCDLCGDTYHMECLLERGKLTYNEHMEWVCHKVCEQTLEILGFLVEATLQAGNPPPLTIVRWSGDDITRNNLDMRVAEGSKLFDAFGLLTKSFMGRNILRNHNIFQSMLYPEAKKHPMSYEKWNLEYNGFYTVLLEEDGQVVTVATLRFHRQNVAEMPWIATLESRRHTGYCNKLVQGLKEMLKRVGVRHLVVQSPGELVQMWESRHSLSPAIGNFRRFLLQCNVLRVEGTTLLCVNL